MAVARLTTRLSPMLLTDMASTVSGLSTRWPFAAPLFRIMRMNLR